MADISLLWSQVARRLASIVQMGVLLLGCAATSAQPLDSNPVAHLKYREVDYGPLVWEIKVDSADHFTKEPSWTNDQVFRGVFHLGKLTNSFISFAWDAHARKLFLDLNRNLDLTDDPVGALTGSGDDVQLFQGLHLGFGRGETAYQVLADAHIFRQGSSVDGAVRVFLYVRSLWDGSIVLAGQRWYLAVMDRPDGRIGPAESLQEVADRMILRPWEDRDKLVLCWHADLAHQHGFSHIKLAPQPYRHAGDAEVFDAFNLPANLFFQEQLYHLDCHIERAGGSANLAVAFQPKASTLGTLRIAGEYVQRLVLDNAQSAEGITALCDRPTNQVLVPVGSYARQIVVLQRAGFTNIAVGIGNTPVAVNAGDAATFQAGGPLSHRVEVAGSSGSPYLQYQLVNAANIPFFLVRQDPKDPPKATLRWAGGGATLAFEFG